MIEVALSNSDQVALIDDVDEPLIAGYRWRLNRQGYALTGTKKGEFKLMHRVIMAVSDPKEEVDHIDGARLNNCRANLRIVNDQQQTQNRRVYKNCKSGIRGVDLHNSGLWRVQVRLGRRTVFQKCFRDLSVAAAAARAARQKYMTHSVET